jgi:hypothetical protein
MLGLQRAQGGRTTNRNIIGLRLGRKLLINKNKTVEKEHWYFP